MAIAFQAPIMTDGASEAAQRARAPCPICFAPYSERAVAGFHPIAAAWIVGLAFTHAGASTVDGAVTTAAELDDARRGYIELQRDMLLAEPSMRVAEMSQIVIYISIDPRATTTLQAASIEIDERVVSLPHYSDAQFAALRLGGSDRVYVGTLPSGANTVSATFSGTRADGKAFARAARLDLPESTQPRYVELKLSHTQTQDVPDIDAQIVETSAAAATDDPLCDWLLGCLVSASARSPSDLRYRSILYPIYQGQHEAALVQAMAITARPHDESDTRLQLALVSAAFATGAHGIALETAAAFDGAQRAPQERIRLAFLRAGDSHRGQDWPQLESAIDEIDRVRAQSHETPPIPARIDAEIQFMRAELATAQGDFDRSQYIIGNQIAPQDSLRAYALFNLGVALRTAGIPSRAEQMFTQLVSMPVYTHDALDLKARARVALSLIDLQRTQSASAEAALRNAPARGRYHDQFMTSYATRAMEHGDYELAARIWLTLTNEAPWSTAGKTAQVAYPMCLEHIAAPNVVLAQYRNAEANFERRLTDLRTLTSRTADPSWDARLLHALAEPPDARVLRLDPTVLEWRDRLGHDDWLYWLNADSTQQNLQALRELERMSTRLSSAVPAAFDARARALAKTLSRLADDRRSSLSRRS